MTEKSTKAVEVERRLSELEDNVFDQGERLWDAMEELKRRADSARVWQGIIAIAVVIAAMAAGVLLGHYFAII